MPHGVIHFDQIGSGNGLQRVRYQAYTWTNADLTGHIWKYPLQNDSHFVSSSMG